MRWKALGLMSQRTYICTNCRTSRRADCAGGFRTDLRCTQCQGPLWELSHKWRIPKNNDLKEWHILHTAVEANKPGRQEAIRIQGQMKLDQIKRKIETFQSNKVTERRDRILKKLCRQRDEITTKYFPKNSQS